MSPLAITLEGRRVINYDHTGQVWTPLRTADTFGSIQILAIAVLEPNGKPKFKQNRFVGHSPKVDTLPSVSRAPESPQAVYERIARPPEPAPRRTNISHQKPRAIQRLVT